MSDGEQNSRLRDELSMNSASPNVSARQPRPDNALSMNSANVSARQPRPDDGPDDGSATPDPFAPENLKSFNSTTNMRGSTAVPDDDDDDDDGDGDARSARQRAMSSGSASGSPRSLNKRVSIVADLESGFKRRSIALGADGHTPDFASAVGGGKRRESGASPPQNGSARSFTRVSRAFRVRFTYVSRTFRSSSFLVVSRGALTEVNYEKHKRRPGRLL
jgi:hypothetical protein